MKYWFCFIGIIIFSSSIIAQNIADDSIKEQLTKKFKPFLSPKETVLDTAMADFNKDGLNDLVIVAEDTSTEEQNRSLIILSNAANGFTVAAKSKAAVLCKSGGGVFGHPYSGISFGKNVLNIYHYGGSNWKWTNNFTFRFQNNQWELIGISNDSFFSGDDCNGEGVGIAGQNLKEVNFSTKKVHIIKTKETNCKPYLNKWYILKSFNKIMLNDFDIDKDYFETLKY